MRCQFEMLVPRGTLPANVALLKLAHKPRRTLLLVFFFRHQRDAVHAQGILVLGFNVNGLVKFGDVLVGFFVDFRGNPFGLACLV